MNGHKINLSAAADCVRLEQFYEARASPINRRLGLRSVSVDKLSVSWRVSSARADNKNKQPFYCLPESQLTPAGFGRLRASLCGIRRLPVATGSPKRKLAGLTKRLRCFWLSQSGVIRPIGGSREFNRLYRATPGWLAGWQNDLNRGMAQF